ncbi:Phosphate-regulating neutral endopeptidase [Strongyloides ratti]|uniref:Phosphate-regulating neutral endopeptidase n=1 Tax=Strongyloides ratti TaxID=34506 RepID=A0A090KQM2_STRRB|nr:Phosphate-regulating neutral endopeptidase [Strongyloides ratti]CEF59674.1 Phosphate-regulating neutral endopeptidase [Strongyloides ratti]
MVFDIFSLKHSSYSPPKHNYYKEEEHCQKDPTFSIFYVMVHFCNPKSEQFSAVSVILFAFSIFLIVCCVVALAFITYSYNDESNIIKIKPLSEKISNHQQQKGYSFYNFKNNLSITTSTTEENEIKTTTLNKVTVVYSTTQKPFPTITFSFKNNENYNNISKLNLKKENYDQKNDNLCIDSECINIASHYKNNMNAKYNPCDDFYHYACDRFGTGKIIPKNELKLTVLYEMKAQLNRDYHILLDNYKINSTTSRSIKLLKNYYDSCMDDRAQDALDQMPLVSLFSSLGGWPLLQNARFDDRHFQWEILASQVHMLGISGLFSFSIIPDIEDTSKCIITFRSPRLLLEHKHLYIPSYQTNGHLQHYKIYMKELMELLDVDTNAIENSLQMILEFEQRLATISTCNEGSVNCQQHHKIKYGDFKKKINTIDWDTFFDINIKKKLEPFNDLTIIDVMDMEYFEGLQNLLKQRNNEVIQNYLMWKILHNFDMYLPQKFREPHISFNEKVYGQSILPLWEECVNEVKKHLPLLITVEYTKSNIKESKYEHVNDLVMNLKNSLRQVIANNDWMSSDGKLKALLKLEKIGVKIGIPKEYLMHENLVTQQFNHITLFSQNYFDNTISLSRSFFDSTLQKLHQPTNNFIEFINQLMDVDAFYHFNGNQIIFSAGILRFPFYGVDAPEYVNYGSLGSGIGHELIHGFDDTGAHFDKNGNLNLWWDKFTQTNYNLKKECFISQYSSILEKFSQRYLNGKQTSIENVADNGGVKLAFDAYKKRLSQIGKDKLLPVFMNMTNNQLFFLSYANTWCEVIKKESINYILDTDSHSLGEYRVNIPLQNYPEFSRAFNCPIGSKMNPFKKCNLW